MKYTVPVQAAEEVSILVSAGADELYCGFQDAWWVSRYGDHDSASRRQGAANFATLEALEATVKAAVACETPIHLALNMRYTEPQLDRLIALCNAFQNMGGTGIIASDLGLLWRLRSHSELERYLSILAVAQNIPTLQAFQELGVSRVVLPRFMQPAEAQKLLAGVPGMHGEVMAFFDKCPWVDGYCRHRHGVTYPARVESVEADAAPLFTFDTTYRTHACLGHAETYLNPHPCAACDLPAFANAGVEFAKIGGRGRPLEERLQALRFLRSVQDMDDPADKAAAYRETFGHACSCYYGNATQDRHAIETEPTLDRGAAGSETDSGAFFRALSTLTHGETADKTAVYVPPLSEEELRRLERELIAAGPHSCESLRFAVNDLGTLVVLARVRREQDLGFDLTVGTLLARSDDPDEIARFLDPSLNPPQAVWDLDGNPRTLRYAPPPSPLVEHWSHPSTCEPSAQAALAHLTGVGAFVDEYHFHSPGA